MFILKEDINTGIFDFKDIFENINEMQNAAFKLAVDRFTHDIGSHNLLLLKLDIIMKKPFIYTATTYHLRVTNVYGQNDLNNINYTNIHTLDKDSPIFESDNHLDLMDFIDNTPKNEFSYVIEFEDFMDHISPIYFVVTKEAIGSYT
jgi:hypothetical protein